ncbi:MAG: modulator protein [Rhodobacterales bacterium CG18_big_fil_WC_8_21_14_2_50_71_9]|nr:MAG: modulator protein [Rhodobacterales bacterium CG18_big_fil_WC_8_21_14_2_50_71_9]PIY74659.1 MAG: modulator protein [Rhodobacterales bacterium CG_4_10_14_0_8_um_filter_70_9]PJA60675.1 MAG: modulator protein [Rhodobacterales bacterium CG_4_9_14_3_um_filter_71_31]
MTDLGALAAQLVDAALKAGADAADALAMSGADVSIAVRGGALEEAGRSETLDFGVRALVGRRQACVSASDARPDTIRALAERAVAMAREAPEDRWCGLMDAGALGAPVDPATLMLQDAAAAPEPAALQALALEAEAAARGVAGVAQVDSAQASHGRTALALAASNGFHGGYARTTVGLSVSAIAGEGTAMEGDYDYAARRRMADLPSPGEIGRRAGARAVARLNPRKAPSGAFPVLFDRRVAPSLIGHLLAAANGAAVARGASWLSGRMGEAVLPDWADVLEDPLLPGGPASRPFDAEGVAARPQPVVTGGRLARWLLDGATARQLGLETTGNARRGVSSPPSPGASNIRISIGDRSPQALMAEMGRGLMVTSLMGASVNPTTGAYSRGAAGFWIENGAIAHPVSEATIAGSLPDFLRRMIAADDPDPYAATSVPALLVEGLVVA